MRLTESEWEWVKVSKSVLEWVKVNVSEWEWMWVSERQWEWVRVNKSEWEWERVKMLYTFYDMLYHFGASDNFSWKSIWDSKKLFAKMIINQKLLFLNW